MGLLRTALIGGAAYKIGSQHSNNDNKNSYSNSTPPPQNNYYYPPAGYPPQQMYGRPPYANPPPPQGYPPYDPAYGYPAHASGGDYGNGGYPPRQSNRSIEDAPMSSTESSTNTPPPYQSIPAHHCPQGHNEKSPAYPQGQQQQQQYQPPRQN